MKISAIRSDKVYSKIMNAPLDKKNDIYRYELMKPFEKKWACYSVPMKALTPNGYDVIMASEMLGHIAPTAVDQKQQNNIKLISDNTLWEKCELSIQQSLNCFVEHGVNLPIKEYAFTILLANAKNPYIILNDGYCGDGGIPGYIFSWLLPNEYTLWFTELRKNSSDLQRISKIICRSKFLAGNIRHGCFHLIDVCIHFRISGFGIRKVTRAWRRAGWLISGIITAGTLLPGHHLFCHSTSCIIWAATWTVHLIIFHEQILSVTNNMSLYFMT